MHILLYFISPVKIFRCVKYYKAQPYNMEHTLCVCLRPIYIKNKFTNMLGMISRCALLGLDLVVGVLDFETLGFEALYLVVVALDLEAPGLVVVAPDFEALEGVWRNSV